MSKKKEEEIIIHTDVPSPEGHGRGAPRKYPFADMDAGDSWLYTKEPYTHYLASKLMSAASYYGGQWTVRKEEVDGEDYIRIWRIK